MESPLIVIPELSRLYSILDRELGNVRLAPAEKIHRVPLYKENRARTDDQREIFDPIGQAPVDHGFWCWTPLYYDESRKPIRRVPEGGGSWNRRRAYRTTPSEGERWRKIKLSFNRFTMIEYSLGGEGDQPECAICHIFPKNEGAARNPPPPDRGQRDLPPNQVVPPENFAHQGGIIADGSNYTLPRHPDGPPETATPDQGPPPSHGNPKRKRKVEIRDSSDGSKWSTEEDWMIKLLDTLKPATQENRQLNVQSLNMGTEGNRSIMQFQAPQLVNESAMHQDQNLSHQPYIMPTQEGLRTNNQDYQQSATLNSDQVQFSGTANQYWDVPDLTFSAPGESSTAYDLGFSDDAPKFY
uniref:Uncharacterized protein LOC105053343 isoform X2 n=1 Tax=Elaeis guineensis var. tenera TaxID=51953 RepID=A0A6I9RUY7_ELAGV|nr:uncharacterized protein LOC105053343 isoform X2 [Elaeis guineensis]